MLKFSRNIWSSFYKSFLWLRCCRNRAVGITLMESSLCFVLFCSLLMMGAGLWNYIDVSNGLTRIADRYAYETTFGMYEYNKVLGRYEIDMSKLRKEIEKVSQQALMELKKEVNVSNDSQIRLEFALTSVPVDLVSGSPRVPRIVSSDEIVSVGQSVVPDFLKDGSQDNGEADFNAAIRSYVNMAGETLAIPTQSFGVNNSQARYLPEAPIIAVRAIYYYEKNTLLRSLGILDQPYGWDIKVAALRGDVG